MMNFEKAHASFIQYHLQAIDVATHLNINHRTAVRSLQVLCAKGWFSPMTGADGKHVVRYEIGRSAMQGL
ncbi:hypothetical protein [Paenibacillus sp. N3.4]|uniref:hypothetical protein n=1 Tax=Paenibacillus sp. N3.4 TaxID=2603222 RepID=UPI0011C782E1|nr:hypothetical protein [Paenibacillus sp. N3.4]TXK79617.1 hypothetical protein FU659_19575 [Paenibacillus sp. N3.4]